MKLFYYRGNNFGDKLNSVMWEGLIPELLDEDESTLLVGMGTLINSRVPAEPRKLVFGSGVGYNKPAQVDDKWKFYCVRGPLTAGTLGLDKSVAITDPALLLTRIYNQPVAQTGEVVFMPHHSSMLNADWAPFCAKAGITFLDPEADMLEVLTRIRGAKLVIAEAMHAAIVADAYRVPWIPVQCYEHILGFKWEDWCQSMSVPYRPQTLPSVWDIDKTLSPRDRLAANVKRGLRGVGIWKDDWTAPPPAKNVRQVEDAVVSALSKLASSGQSYLTDERLQQIALERLMGQIDQLKRDSAVMAA